jgi:hypothetical protein
MAQVQHHLLHISTEKTKRRSLSSTLDPFPNHEHIIALVQVLVVEAVLSVEDVVSYRDLVDEAVLVGQPKVDDGVKDSVGEDSGGKIMINRNAFVMQVSKSNRIGNYSKRSSLAGFRNLRSSLWMVKTCMYRNIE